ncbi:MAG: SIS domain-containing protein [Clostridiaceae bacterium]|nr:SIS domain-containing protein [Eubacteriales bacterium]
MLHEKDMQACSYFLDCVKTGVPAYADSLSGDELQRAAELILKARQSGNRVHISGIGKPAHLAGYAASLLSSTGTPTYFLHGTEAVHGSCGQLVAGDVVIFISNSGETQEMLLTVQAVQRNRCQVIGVTGNRDSWLARSSDVHIYAGTPVEGGPLNRAPRMSILVEMIAIQALSVLLQEHAQISPQQYVRWHPGGKLGALWEDEK